MERLPFYRDWVCLCHPWQNAGFQSVPSRSKGIQRLPVAENDSFLTFVHNELAPCHKICHRVLPHKGLVVAFVTDDGWHRSSAGFSLLDLLLHIAVGVTHRANNMRCCLICLQLTAAGRAAEMHQIVEAVIRNELRVTDRTLSVLAFRLIVNYAISAARSNHRRHAIRLTVNAVSAVTADMFA